MLNGPVPSGPAVGLPKASFALLPAMVRFVPPARLTPPVKVLAPESCKLPPPVTLIGLLAFVIIEVMINAVCKGAIFWPLKVIGLTVIDGVAASFRFNVPPVMVAFVEGLFEEAVMEPLVSVSVPIGLSVGAVVPP